MPDTLACEVLYPSPPSVNALLAIVNGDDLCDIQISHKTALSGLPMAISPCALLPLRASF